MGIAGAECLHIIRLKKRKAKGKSEHDELLGFFILSYFAVVVVLSNTNNVSLLNALAMEIPEFGFVS